MWDAYEAIRRRRRRHTPALLLVGSGLFAPLPLVGCSSSDDGPEPTAGAAASSGDAGLHGGGGTGGGPAGGGGHTVGGAGGSGGEPPPFGMARYLPGPIHSPLTPYVRDHLLDIRAAGSGMHSDVFMKAGDSITVDPNYLSCLASAQTDLSLQPALQNAHGHFRAGDAAGATPFDRESLAAEGGKTTDWVLSPDPVESPLEQEIAAVYPAFAVVMFGTNDMGWYPDNMPHMFRWYGENYLYLVDGLIAHGIVPVVFSIPARTNDAFLDLWVPTVNQFVRAVAQTRQIPFVDGHLALQSLPDAGLWPDGVHPNAAPGGACDFTAEGLDYGQNVRNLITLEALDRLYETVVLTSPAPDTGTFELSGTGVAADPIVVDELPFFDWRSTANSASDSFDSYSPCGNGENESGPEVVYQLELSQATALRVLVLDMDDVDIDIQLLGPTVDPASCLARGDTLVQGTVGPGIVHLVADTFHSASGDHPGDYLLVVTTCEPGDDSCEGEL